MDVDGCVLDVLWMCSGLAYYFFSPLSLQLLTTICHTFLIIAKYVFFVLSRAWDQEEGVRIFFSVPCSRQDTKKYLFLFTDLKNYNNIFLIQFCNTSLENFVLDQLTITLLTYFFIPITCLLDIVRRNSVLVTHIG